MDRANTMRRQRIRVQATRGKSTLPACTLALSLLWCGAATANLITNGDFEAGNTGFSTDLGFSPGDITPAGVYDILPDPATAHPSADSYGDHTTGGGNMMAVNGSTSAGDLVWGQTVIVDPATTYDFAAWISSWVSASPAELAFTVNGSTIGTLSAPATTGSWVLAFATWTSGASTSADIEIRNSNTAFSGNDFGLDDLFFGNPIFSSPVPEPVTPALVSVALAAVGLSRRRRPAAHAGRPMPRAG